MSAIALRFLLAHWKTILIGIAVCAALAWAYSAIYQRGYDAADREWKAAQDAAAAKAAADTILLHDAIAEIDQGVTTDLEAIDAVRVVYRDKIRTVAIAADRPDCALADGLREQINTAAAAYRSAAAGSGGPVVRPADPAP